MINYEKEYSDLEKEKVQNYLRERKICGATFGEDNIEIVLDDGTILESDLDIDFILTEINDKEAEG